jgi:putative nucleotidyltransferase with HDIG domain
MPRSVRIYVSFVAVAALMSIALLYRFDADVRSAEVAAGIAYACLGFVAQILIYRTIGMGGRSDSSTAFLPILAAVILSPNWTTAASIAISSIASEAWARREPLKALFNVSQQTVSIAAAIFICRYLGGESLLFGHTLGPYISAILTFFFANKLAVSCVVALTTDQNVGRLMWEQTRSTLMYDLLSLPFVYVFATLYTVLGFWGVVILAIPLFGLRELYKKNEELHHTNQELLELMVAAIEARDPYTSGHSRRVSHTAQLIAKQLGFKEKAVERVRVAALLHDVGKIYQEFGPILQKPGRLTNEEFAIMKTHSIKSADLVSRVSLLADLVVPIRHHHENWDGSGYPDGLSGEAIPLISRIIMFADTIDAMTTDRPYRRALDRDAVRRELIKWRARQFDPAICDVVLNSHIVEQVVPDVGPPSVTPLSEQVRNIAVVSA